MGLTFLYTGRAHPHLTISNSPIDWWVPATRCTRVRRVRGAQVISPLKMQNKNVAALAYVVKHGWKQGWRGDHGQI